MPREHQNVTVWVTARQAFSVAMEALGSHKLRSFLTLLGVVIATTTLIVVMSIVNGMNVYIAEHVANLGTNTSICRNNPESFASARKIYLAFIRSERAVHATGIFDVKVHILARKIFSDALTINDSH